MSACYCSSGRDFENCCLPLLEAKAIAKKPEALMRSRFSAYCTQNYQYIYDTYGAEQRQNLTVDILRESAGNSKWLGLEVIETTQQDVNAGTVEFIATYADGKKIFQMHELSFFIHHDGKWFYTDGVSKAQTGQIKLSRNAPCPCRSGKKFKQCCINRL